jgi:DNA-binding beta-propeller fold protein YncE
VREGIDVQKTATVVVEVDSGAVTVIPVCAAPEASIDTVRINAAGTRLYGALTTADGGALVMIDVRTGRVQTVPVGDSIDDIAVDRSQRRVYVTGSDEELGTLYCGEVTSQRSYCKEHYALCYYKPDRK